MESMDIQKARGLTYHVCFTVKALDLEWAMRDKKHHCYTKLKGRCDILEITVHTTAMSDSIPTEDISALIKADLIFFSVISSYSLSWYKKKKKQYIVYNKAHNQQSLVMEDNQDMLMLAVLSAFVIKKHSMSEWIRFQLWQINESMNIERLASLFSTSKKGLLAYTHRALH